MHGKHLCKQRPEQPAHTSEWDSVKNSDPLQPHGGLVTTTWISTKWSCTHLSHSWTNCAPAPDFQRQPPGRKRLQGLDVISMSCNRDKSQFKSKQSLIKIKKQQRIGQGNDTESELTVNSTETNSCLRAQLTRQVTSQRSPGAPRPGGPLPWRHPQDTA